MNWHVTPTNDLQPHEESTTCKCEPKVEIMESGDMLVIHNSYDGRELFEEINEFFNNKTKNKMAELSLGEQRVRTDFNVAGSSKVDAIKQKSADLINMIEELKAEKSNNGAKLLDGEFVRLCSLAQTDFENAAMWAVKAATA